MGTRELGLFAAVAAATVTGTALGMKSNRASPATGPSCIAHAAAGVMGGGTWHLCGAQARAYCASRAADGQCGRLNQVRARARAAP